MAEGGGAGGRAIVIGGSVGGLSAARVLSDYFEEVRVLERDPEPRGIAVRKGAPQGGHIHVLQAGAQATLGGFFPGIEDEMVAAGSVSFEAGTGFLVFQNGGWGKGTPLGIPMYAQTRPLLEDRILHRVRQFENIELLWSRRVTSLGSERSGAITSVTSMDSSGAETAAEAELVIDASGRGTRSRTWLNALGHLPPRRSVIDIDIKYTTCLYERPDEDDLPKGMMIRDYPRTKIGASLVAVENDQWLLSLSGRFGQYPPRDVDGILECTAELAMPEVHEFLKNQSPTTRPVAMNFPTNQRWHYEELEDFPAGFLPLGDAVLSLNPLYGQGMTSALMQARILGETLEALTAEGGSPADIAPLYFPRMATFMEEPWMRAAVGDYVFEETTGDRPPDLDERREFNAGLARLAAGDSKVREAMFRVNQYLDPPEILEESGIADRVRALLAEEVKAAS